MYSNAQYIMVPPATEPTMIRVDINGVTSFVPLDPDNRDYANIMALVADGKLTIAEAAQ